MKPENISIKNINYHFKKNKILKIIIIVEI